MFGTGMTEHLINLTGSIVVDDNEVSFPFFCKFYEFIAVFS